MEQAVRAAYAASVAAGAPLSQRAMAERFGLSRRRVSQLVAQVTVGRQWPPARERGSMSMKPYDELPWWCQLLWPWFGPPWYEQVEDLDAYLAVFRPAVDHAGQSWPRTWPATTSRVRDTWPRRDG